MTFNKINLEKKICFLEKSNYAEVHRSTIDKTRYKNREQPSTRDSFSILKQRLCSCNSSKLITKSNCDFILNVNIIKPRIPAVLQYLCKSTRADLISLAIEFKSSCSFYLFRIKWNQRKSSLKVRHY